MNNLKKDLINFLISFLISIALGTILILLIGENPLQAFSALIKGAVGSTYGFGNTIALWTPLLLTSLAFAIAAQAGAFNVGIEGEVILGGMAAAYIGANWGFLPVPLLYIACFLGAIIVAGLWAYIPGILKVKYNISEICVTILMNSVAVYIGSYLVSGPLSSGNANPQTDPVWVTLAKFLRPSSANVGFFIALLIVIVTSIVMYKTRLGENVRAAGLNPRNMDYVGKSSKKTFVRVMVLSGMIAGVAGCIQVLGVHGYYLDGFATGLGNDGMLASLIVRSNITLTPLTSFFLALLKAGAVGMQNATRLPKALVDTITSMFIIIATMDVILQFIEKRKLKKEDAESKAEFEETMEKLEAEESTKGTKRNEVTNERWFIYNI